MNKFTALSLILVASFLIPQAIGHAGKGPKPPKSSFRASLSCNEAPCPLNSNTLTTTSPALVGIRSCVDIGIFPNQMDDFAPSHQNGEKEEFFQSAQLCIDTKHNELKLKIWLYQLPGLIWTSRVITYTADEAAKIIGTDGDVCVFRFYEDNVDLRLAGGGANKFTFGQGSMSIGEVRFNKLVCP